MQTSEQRAFLFLAGENFLGISFAMISLLKFTILTVITSHWLACSLVLIGRLNPADEGEPVDLSVAFGVNWIHRAGLQSATPVEMYGVAIYVALATITSGTSGMISPASPLEYYLMTLMGIVGSGVWAYVLSSACSILASLDPNGMHYRNMMDELNYFSKDKNLPQMMVVKLREFLSQVTAECRLKLGKIAHGLRVTELHADVQPPPSCELQTHHVHRQSRYEEVLGMMSARLKADAALCWAKETLLRVSYFKNPIIEDDFLASAALALKAKLFCRTESIPVHSLLIIERGTTRAQNTFRTTPFACQVHPTRAAEQCLEDRPLCRDRGQNREDFRQGHLSWRGLSA